MCCKYYSIYLLCLNYGCNFVKSQAAYILIILAYNTKYVLNLITHKRVIVQGEGLQHVIYVFISISAIQLSTFDL